MRKMVLKMVGLAIIIVSICIIAFACASERDDHQHSWTESTNVVGTSAKCTETIRTCSHCNAKEVISNPQHDYSCDTPQRLIRDGIHVGYTQHYLCKVCGYGYTRSLTTEEISDANLPLPGDDTSDSNSDVSQPVNSDTSDTTSEEEPSDTPSEPDTSEIPEDSTPPETSGDAECEHQYTVTTVAPTCTKTGYAQHVCSKCGKTYVTDKTDATGHSYGSWSTTKPATCESEGTRTRKCTKCGDEQREPISATGHSYGEWTVTKDSTCEINGVKKRYCSKCGDAQQDTVPPKGHTWQEDKTTTTPATCGDIGVRFYTCTVCGSRRIESVTGNHTFGEWEYEEYQYTITYKPDDPGYSPGHTVSVKTSHRKIRKCTKCGYTERDSTPDHVCTRKCPNHKVTTLKEGTCTTPALMRSTCTICGWYEDYDGAKGKHKSTRETRHLTDYTEYTNELDAEVSHCSVCGKTFVVYILGKGFNENYNFYAKFSHNTGNAYFGVPINDYLELVEHPTWQMVSRDYVLDDAGYVVKYTFYWWYNGQRYSQVVNCGPGEIEAWFKEYGLTDSSGGRGTYHIGVFGTYLAPYRISWTS